MLEVVEELCMFFCLPTNYFLKRVTCNFHQKVWKKLSENLLTLVLTLGVCFYHLCTSRDWMFFSAKTLNPSQTGWKASVNISLPQILSWIYDGILLKYTKYLYVLEIVCLSVLLGLLSWTKVKLQTNSSILQILTTFLLRVSCVINFDPYNRKFIITLHHLCITFCLATFILHLPKLNTYCLYASSMESMFAV